MNHRGRPRHDDVLTPREWDVLTCIREGLTNEEIAERLGVSSNTVKYHVSEILGKLEVRSREEAAAWRGKPKVAFGLAPVAAFLQQAGSMSPWKVAGGGVLVAAGVGLVLLALGVLLSNDGASLGKIAFVRDGNIWVQELPDGTPYQLTDKGASSMPRWSPSGEWLLFNVKDPDAEEAPGLQLWVSRSDGTGQRKMSDEGLSGYWLPDEPQRLFFFASNQDSIAEDADGSNREVIFSAYDDGSERVFRFPFRPAGDGQYEVFFEIRESASTGPRDVSSQETTIWVQRRDGSDARQLFSINPAGDVQLLPYGLSGDGEHLLLAQLVEEPEELRTQVELYSMPLASGDVRPLDLTVSLNESSSIGAGGHALVTGNNTDSWTGKRIALIAPDLSGHAPLTDEDVAAISPAWAPDGGAIAYVAAPDFGPDTREQALAARRIWLMAPDGSDKRQLTDGEGIRDEWPMWSSDGQSIVFARMSTEDPCYSDTYDLMRYELADGTMEVIAPDLPLYGTWVTVEVGQIPPCESRIENLTTETFGSLNLATVLTWWQPGDN